MSNFNVVKRHIFKSLFVNSY